MKRLAFTNLNLIGLTISSKRPNLYPYIICTTWGVFTSFNSCYVINPNALKKLNKKCNNLLLIGNLTTHILPCIITLWYPPKQKMKFVHGLIASIAHLSWGLSISKGSLLLNDIYSEMPKGQWYLLWKIAIITELLTPYYFNKLIIK